MDSDARASLMDRGPRRHLRTWAAGFDRRADRGRPNPWRCRRVRRVGDVRPDRGRPPTASGSTDDEFDSATVSEAVDRSIDDAITHLRAFNEAQMERVDRLEHRIRTRPHRRREDHSDLVRRSVHAVGEGQLSERRLPARRPGGRRRRSRSRPSWFRPCPAVPGEVDPAVLVVCRKLGLRSVFRVNGPAGIAALGFGTESIPKVRKIVGPGSPAVTIAQVEMQRHGTATMMLLGPTESLVIADDSADPDAARRRPPHRSRARHRLVGGAAHPVVDARRCRRCGGRPPTAPCSPRSAPRPPVHHSDRTEAV